MYRNINNMYYFNRPNYGYVYGNHYRLNFSRRYPRVVMYNGQQNFGFIGDNWGKLLIAGGLAAAGLHHFAPDVLGHIGSGLSNIAHSAGEGISKAAHSVGDFVSDKWHKFNEWKDFRDLKHTLAGRVAPENLDEMAHRIKEASKGNLDYTYDPDNNNKIQKMIKKGMNALSEAKKSQVDVPSEAATGGGNLTLEAGSSDSGASFVTKNDISKRLNSSSGSTPLRTSTQGSPFQADNISRTPNPGPYQPLGLSSNSKRYLAWGPINRAN